MVGAAVEGAAVVVVVVVIIVAVLLTFLALLLVAKDDLEFIVSVGTAAMLLIIVNGSLLVVDHPLLLSWHNVCSYLYAMGVEQYSMVAVFPEKSGRGQLLLYIEGYLGQIPSSSSLCVVTSFPSIHPSCSMQSFSLPPLYFPYEY